jgi:4-oxalocrotonate tautomerase
MQGLREVPALLKGRTRISQVCGGKPRSVWILFEDIDKADWSIGGELCSDLYPDAPTSTKK